MTSTANAEQLKIWNDETEVQTKSAAITEFEQWCANLSAHGLTRPLDPGDKRAVAFAVAFHDVVADFEELEAPALRREPDQPGLGHSLTEWLIALRLLQGAIDECGHRGIRVPREILRLRAAVREQIYCLRSARTPGGNEQQTDVAFYRRTKWNR